MIRIYVTDYEMEEGVKKYSLEHQKGIRLLQYGIKDSYNLDITERELLQILECGICGKPFLRGFDEIQFNISHCDGIVVCALSDEQVGIDIERIGDFNDCLSSRVLNQEEQSFLAGCKNDKNKYKEVFYRFWTLKESYMKWKGSGFYMDPKDVFFKLDFRENPIQIYCSDSKVDFYQVVIAKRYILSLCGEHTAGIEMKYRTV